MKSISSGWLVVLFFPLLYYNVQSDYGRLFIVGVMFLSPIFLLGAMRGPRPHAHYWELTTAKSKSWGPTLKINVAIALAFSVLAVMLISTLKSVTELPIRITGPTVEAYTLVLVWLVPIYLLLIEKLKHTFHINISRLTWLVVLFGVVEVTVRFYLEPDCFLNYSCRKAAKTVGFFTTTNVLGGIYVIFLLAVEASNERVSQLPLNVLRALLITTMARSAIIAYVLVFIFVKVQKASTPRKLLLAIVVGVVLTPFIIIDPYALKTDGSLKSKFDFLMAATNVVMASSTFEILFGYGPNYYAMTERLDVEGWSPHIHIVKALLYWGVGGVVAFVLSLLLLISANKKILAPVLAYLLFGFAGAPMFHPSLIAALMMLELSRCRSQEVSKT